MYVLGLMSGTSADGVDAALVEFRGNVKSPRWQLSNFISFPYPPDLQKRIIDVGQGLKLCSSEWLELAENITEIHFLAAKQCDPNAIAKVYVQAKHLNLNPSSLLSL